jgi:hypothetical protein
MVVTTLASTAHREVELAIAEMMRERVSLNITAGREHHRATEPVAAGEPEQTA